jgi:hypothetical protein
MYGPVKGERWIIRRQEEIKGIFQEANTVKFDEIPQRLWHCLERLQTQQGKEED